MKKYLLLALVLGSSSVMAHSHMPQTFGGKDKPNEAVTFTGVKVVPIIVGNFSDTPQEYEITVRGEKVAETPLLSKGVTYPINVPVKLLKKNVPETVKVCSTSILAPQTIAYRTRICTYAKLLWTDK